MNQDLTKHTTAQVVAALSKYHDWTAEAPQIGLLAEQKAHTEDGGRWGFSIVFQDRLHTWELSQRFVERPDWTIRRADGSIVERRPKRKRVKCGITSIIKPGFWGFSKPYKKGFGNLDPSKSYTMICIEKP
jgi:hypothetical protein